MWCRCEHGWQACFVCIAERNGAPWASKQVQLENKREAAEQAAKKMYAEERKRKREEEERNAMPEEQKQELEEFEGHCRADEERLLKRLKQMDKEIDENKAKEAEAKKAIEENEAVKLTEVEIEKLLE